MTEGPYSGRVLVMGGYLIDENDDVVRENDVWRTEFPCAWQEAPGNGSWGTCSGYLESRTLCQPECDDGYTEPGQIVCTDGERTTVSCVPLPCPVGDFLVNLSFGECGDDVYTE